LHKLQSSRNVHRHHEKHELALGHTSTSQAQLVSSRGKKNCGEARASENDCQFAYNQKSLVFTLPLYEHARDTQGRGLPRFKGAFKRR